MAQEWKPAHTPQAPQSTPEKGRGPQDVGLAQLSRQLSHPNSPQGEPYSTLQHHKLHFPSERKQISKYLCKALLGEVLLGPSTSSANICIPELGLRPGWSCHIFAALSQELYHKLITHTSLHHEIKQVGDGSAACCHSTAPSSLGCSLLGRQNMWMEKTHICSPCCCSARPAQETQQHKGKASPAVPLEAQHP